MLQNDEPFFPKSNLMQKLRQDEDQLQNEKKEYLKYQSHLNKEIKDLFSKNEQLLSCFISHKKIYEDLELRSRQLDERYEDYLLEESRSKKIRARLTQLKNKQNPIYPSRVLIPMETDTQNLHIQLSKEYQDLESKISEINVDNISKLLEEKQKLEEKHIKLKKEASELMSLLDKPENKLSKKTESLFYHMINAMNECDKNRKKLFILKHGTQSQIDDLKLYTDDNKDETNDVIDLLNLFPDIQPSPNLQDLINEEMELKKRKEAKRKRIEAMKKKDEEFLRNLNQRQKPNYYQIRPPSQKKGTDPNASISDSGEKNRNDQISKLRLTLNNHYAALKSSNQKEIPITSPTGDNSLLPAHKKYGRRKINSKQIFIGDPQKFNDQFIEETQIEQDNNKSRRLVRKRRKKEANQNTNSAKKHGMHIHSSEFASSSSASASRKREENIILSVDQNMEENINYDRKNDQENQRSYIRKVHRRNNTSTNHDWNNEESDEDNQSKSENDGTNFQLNIEDKEFDSESTNGNTFEFEQTLELQSRWRFHVEKQEEPKPVTLHIDHNPKQFVEEESNKEDYSKTEILQEVEMIEEEEENDDSEKEKTSKKITIQKKKSKRRRKHKHHEDDDNLDKSKTKTTELIRSNHRKSSENKDDKPISTEEIDLTITKPNSSRRSNSVQNENKRKRKRKHRSKSIDPKGKEKENQEEEEIATSQKEEAATSQKIDFKLKTKKNKKSNHESTDETEDNNNNNDTKKPLKKKRLMNLEIAKKPVIIDEQKSTIENLGGKPHRSHSNHRSHHHHHQSKGNSNNSNKSRSSNNSNNSNNSSKKNEIKTKDNDDDYDYDDYNDDGYPSDKNYEYNYEYDYEFDDKDYYSNDNKHSKRRRHGHHYRRKTNRRFYTHHPRHRNIYRNSHRNHNHSHNHRHNYNYNNSHRQSSRNYRYSTQRPKIKRSSRSRKSYDNDDDEKILIEEEEEEKEEEEVKKHKQRRNVRSRKQEPRRVRRHHDYYSNSSDYYSDSYHYSDNDNDNDYDYNYNYDDSNGYNTVSDGYEYEIQEDNIFTPLNLQISKEICAYEEKEKLRNPRVFLRKIIPKQTQQQGSDKASLLSLSLKTENDPSNLNDDHHHKKQIKESKTFSQLNTLNDFVIHEPNEAFESLRRRGKGDQLDLEIAQTREKLSKIDNDINELQKKLKMSLLKEASSQVDDPFSMKSLLEMKNKIKDNQNLDDLINQAKKQKELLEQELPSKQDRLNDLQKLYVRKAATLRHYKQIKDELDEKHFFLINASKKQIKKLNDLDEQIRRGRSTIEILDGRLADIRNIIDLKTKELSIKANKKRPNVVGMCDKFKRDRLSEKEILQLIDYHDIERQYLEKAIESISYQLSDDSLTKKGFEIERFVITAKKLKEKYFEKRGMSNQTMITITNEDDLNSLSKRKALTKEEIHSTMMQIDLVISQIQKQISQLSNKNIEVPPPPSSFINLQALKKSKLENMTSLY